MCPVLPDLPTLASTGRPKSILVWLGPTLVQRQPSWWFRHQPGWQSCIWTPSWLESVSPGLPADLSLWSCTGCSPASKGQLLEEQVGTGNKLWDKDTQDKCPIHYTLYLHVWCARLQIFASLPSAAGFTPGDAPHASHVLCQSIPMASSTLVQPVVHPAVSCLCSIVNPGCLAQSTRGAGSCRGLSP